jgi:hypothetical protein
MPRRTERTVEKQVHSRQEARLSTIRRIARADSSAFETNPAAGLSAIRSVTSDSARRDQGDHRFVLIIVLDQTPRQVGAALLAERDVHEDDVWWQVLGSPERLQRMGMESALQRAQRGALLLAGIRRE